MPDRKDATCHAVKLANLIAAPPVEKINAARAMASRGGSVGPEGVTTGKLEPQRMRGQRSRASRPLACYRARMTDHSASERVARWGGIAVAVNLLVIVWGAFVRASGSGAGCGNHWPLCNGTVVPKAPALETLIELTHRLTSGVALLVVLWLLWLACRTFPPRHRVRLAAWSALILIVIEALLGAGLVKFELVAENDSVERAIVLAAHLVNTQFLLAALALTAWWARGEAAIDVRVIGARLGWLVLVALALLIVGVTGAVASLGNTLFPAESLRAGLAQDLDPASHFLLRLRVLHPFFAVGTGMVAIVVAALAPHWRGGQRQGSTQGRLVQVVVVVQWTLGVVTLLLLAPIPMQLLHLLTADVLWICWVIFCAAVLARQDAGTRRTSVASARADSASNTVPAPSSR
jgi:cytochrome c oxidase assembly protein subunit 15